MISKHTRRQRNQQPGCGLSRDEEADEARARARLRGRERNGVEASLSANCADARCRDQQGDEQR